MSRTPTRLGVLLAAALLLSMMLTPSAWAQGFPQAKVTGVVDTTAFAPGKSARLGIVVDVPKGFHAQSNTPTDEAFIKCEVALDAPPDGVTLGAIAYPKGQVKEYPALGKMSVYEGKVVIVVPVTVAPTAKPGKVSLSGRVTVQLCDDQNCFPPDDVKFAIDVTIVDADTEILPANQELFPKQDGTAAPTTAPSAQGALPPGAGGPPAPLNFSLLGIDGTIDSLAAAFVAAIVAGLLFNVMPCVLPVLPLKAIGFFEASQHDRRRAFMLGVAFSVGVVGLFAAMSLLVVFSRPLFGSQFSWGQQFSNPTFVAAVVIVLTILGCAMLGMFAMRLPTSVYGLNFRHDTITGNVMWGGLTAILSTPCTAPLFPLVIAFAMGQSSVLIGICLVLAVGVGMSLPYLVLSAFPQLARRFPRTGAFSELFRQVLAFPIFGTAAFFAGSMLGSEQLQTTLIFGVATATAVFIVMRTQQLYSGRTGPLLWASGVSAGVVLVALWVFVPRDPGPDTARLVAGTTDSSPASRWVDYSPESHAESLRQGRPVLIKFTAKWCANCIVLDKTVYRDADVLRAVDDRQVVLMKLDVDKAGWDLLNGLAPGAGIPYTAIYQPKSPAPLLLASMHDSAALIRLIRGGTPGVASTDASR